MSRQALRTDPFAPEANPAYYVPRAATEETLDALCAALRTGARAVALAGPPGIGKRMLLRVLEERLREDFRCVLAATAKVSAAELSALALDALGEPAGASPEASLLRAARRGPPVALLLPALDALPPDAARRVGVLLREAEGTLRIVGTADDGAATVAIGSPETSVEIALRDAMTPQETSALLEERLGFARAPDTVRLRFHAEERARLHLEGRGIPGRVLQLARALLEAPETSPTPARAGDDGRPRLDPFGLGAGPDNYQPRAATEATLARLEGELREGARVLLLRGPTGIGKTTLLRVLSQRLKEPFQPVEVPYARFEPEDFFSYTLFQLGAPRGERPGDDVELVARRLSAVGGILVLVIDEAQALPEATRAALARAVERADGALRLVLAADASTPPGLFEVFARKVDVDFVEGLDEAEASAYVKGRLDYAAAPEPVRRRFDSGTLASLFRASQGNPRELNRLASEVERGELPDPIPPPQPGPSVPRPEPIGRGLRRGPAEPAAAPEAPVRVAAPEPLPVPAAPPGAPAPAADPSPAPAAARTDAPAAAPSPVTPAPARPPAAGPRVPRARQGPRDRLRRLDAEARSVLPHVAMGAGIPLALFSLWLWMAPLFAPPPGPEAGAAAPIPVHVNATPWAHIEVDGRPIGTTPLGNVPLPAGEHTFRAELPDGTVLTRRVRIDEAHRHVVFP